MIFIINLLCLLSINVFALTTDFVMSEVEIRCQKSEKCHERKERFKNLTGKYRGIVHFKDTLRVIASDGGYESLSYQIIKKNDKHKLIVDMKLKPIIGEIRIGTIDRNINLDPRQLLNVREGEFFEKQKLNSDLKMIKKRLETLGYPDNFHKLEISRPEDKVIIAIMITLGKPLIFKGIKTNSHSQFVKDFLKRKFYHFYNKPFEVTKFKLYLDEAQKDLFSYGHYLINLDFSPSIKDHRVIVDINVTRERLFTFDFKNLEYEKRDIIQNLVKDLFKKYKKTLSEPILKMAIEDHYRQKSLLDTQVSVKIIKFKNKYMEDVTLYRIFFEENQKTRLKKVIFSGNTFFENSQLKSMFKNEAFELARLKYFDEDYFNYFVGFLKGKYFEKGFVQVNVIGPIKVINEKKLEGTIEYVIQEGRRSFVRKLDFVGLPEDLLNLVESKIYNKKGVAFNPIAMAEDLKIVTNLLQDHGYYYAEISNANEESLITYSQSGSDVDIKYNIIHGPLLRFNRVIYLGNIKTRKKILSKKINLKRGEIITPEKTREIEANISTLGLFNSVSVSPLKHSSKVSSATDLIVKVTERDYGLIEFAPGFRTDLGIKLTSTASYLNIGGMNRSITLKNDINQRINYQTFDPRRRKERRELVEHSEALTYNHSNIFNTEIASSTGFAFQRRRFYSFDADIFRVNNTFTRDLTKKLSSSVRYQYEQITQTDATEPRDNDSFKIGAITPGLTYDLRNSSINPIEGAFFNLSCEFANPFFLSQREDDLTINYYKLVSRNRFYIPYSNGTIAISMVAGIQENLSRDKVEIDGATQFSGYIPNIKVFRLSGMDIVRGFNDEEINRVPGTDRDDISSIRVDNRAYLANFKLEPRFFINDSLMAGVFYDAGRVFVDQFNLGELRDSVGVTFKILTPVGSLDFDYGIKLLRERNKNGTLEDPGRFHVSIGFF